MGWKEKAEGIVAAQFVASVNASFGGGVRQVNKFPAEARTLLNDVDIKRFPNRNIVKQGQEQVVLPATGINQDGAGKVATERRLADELAGDAPPHVAGGNIAGLPILAKDWIGEINKALGANAGLKLRHVAVQ